MNEDESLQDISTPDLLKQATVALAELDDKRRLIDDMRLDLNALEKTLSRLNNELTKRLG